MLGFLEENQNEWFERIRPYLLSTNLEVGSGLGHFSKLMESAGIQVTSLDVIKHPEAISLRNFVLYDGKEIPFKDASFEASIAMYVLHHVKERDKLLKEMKRVSSRRIILVEELYHGWFGKLRLMRLDIWVNFKLRQKSDIHWRSYFDSDSFEQEVEQGGWKIVHLDRSPRGGFDEVLCILDRR